MSLRRCEGCAGSSVVHDESIGGEVCVNCGRLRGNGDRADLRVGSEVRFGGDGGPPGYRRVEAGRTGSWKFDRWEQWKKRLLRRVQAVALGVGLYRGHSGSRKEELVSIVDQVTEYARRRTVGSAKEENDGASLKVMSAGVPAAIVALCARKSSVAVTLREIAAAAGVAEKIVARALFQLRRLENVSSMNGEVTQVLHPRVFVPRCVQAIVGSDASMIQPMVRMALAWVQESDTAYIADGRRPAAVAISCVVMSAFALGVTQKPSAALEQLSDSLNVGKDTTRTRFAELRTRLTAKCRSFLPHGSRVTEKNVHQHLETLLTLASAEAGHEELADDEEHIPPPLKKRREECSRREEKLKRAKARIRSTVEDDDGSECDRPDLRMLDDEDAEIETLVLLGIPEDLIIHAVSFTNAAQQGITMNRYHDTDDFDEVPGEQLCHSGAETHCT